MQLIVGLGNPGSQYERTRHNVGFMVLDHLHRQHSGTPWRSQYKSQFGAVTLPGGRKVWLCKPQTFMNLSGEAVAQATAFYRIPRQDVLVISDDFALPLGKLRIREKGSSGGHNGLSSVEECLGGQDYPRLRVGVGPMPARWSWPDFVLSNFAADEQDMLAKVVTLSSEAVVGVVQHGVTTGMNRYNNQDLRPPPETDKPSTGS